MNLRSSSTDLREEAAKCIFYGSGVIFSLVYYGILQERMMTQPYDNEVFQVSLFLVMCNRLAAVAFSVLLIPFTEEPLQSKAPLWKYLVVAMANVLGSCCQYESLKYVSFVVQMLAKSFKMTPVMLWSMAISKKRYSCHSWLVAAAMTFGVLEFLMTGPSSSTNHHGSSLYGLGLLTISLVLDGLTSTMQEQLFKEHKTTKWNQMLYVNGLALVFSGSALLVSGSAGPALSFWERHPDFRSDTTSLSLLAVVSQYFVYSQVQEFGALVFATTVNVRQVVSILLSYSTFGHEVTRFQLGGLAVVFLALFYKTFRAIVDASSSGEATKLTDEAFEATKERMKS